MSDAQAIAVAWFLILLATNELLGLLSSSRGERFYIAFVRAVLLWMMAMALVAPP